MLVWRALALFQLRYREESLRRKAAMALFGYSISGVDVQTFSSVNSLLLIAVAYLGGIAVWEGAVISGLLFQASGNGGAGQAVSWAPPGNPSAWKVAGTMMAAAKMAEGGSPPYQAVGDVWTTSSGRGSSCMSSPTHLVSISAVSTRP